MLSHRIVALRKRNSMNQAQLAEALNISASAVGMYEQGRRVPNLDVLVAMAKVFHVSLDYLITGEEYESGDDVDNVAVITPCPCSTCFRRDMRKANSFEV